MKVLYFTMKYKRHLTPILSSLSDHGIPQATVFETSSMTRILHYRSDEDEVDFINASRSFLQPAFHGEHQYTLLILLDEEVVEDAIAAIEEVTGNLDENDVGILYTFAAGDVRGLKR